MDAAVSYVEVAPAPVLGAKRAFGVLLGFVAVQLATGALLGFFGGLWYVLTHGSGTLAGHVIGALVAFRIARRTLAGPIASGALVSIGWARASSRDLLRASVAGVGLGLVYVFVLVPAFPPFPGGELGPLASAAIAGGWARHVWAVLAVVVAPPVEEFVFRGVLLTGFRRSWGLAPAGAFVSVLFVAVHFSEIAYAGPAIVGVALVTGATLIARLAGRSLAPAIALHASYNLALVVATYASGV
jgi:membrane protease YdiL (CAAX protease family)